MIALFSAIIVVVICFSITSLICHFIDKKAESDLKKICDKNNDCEFCPRYYMCYLRRR